MESRTLRILILLFHSALASGCGVAISGGRIVGGIDSGGFHYPWFALLRLKSSGDPPVCAGSLITTRHVLTAAHCFFLYPGIPKEELFSVALGLYDRCNEKESTKQIFNTVRVDVHEEYVKGRKFHDIALMTLDRTADFTTVCLPNRGLRDKTEPALLIGFGATEQDSNRLSCHMMEAWVTKYSRQDCRKSQLPQEDISEESVICAGDTRGGRDSCQGDSGGPLLTRSSEGRYIVSGLVSFGYGCGNPGLLGLYTDVSYYLNWIQRKISRRMSRQILSNILEEIRVKRDDNSHVHFQFGLPTILPLNVSSNLLNILFPKN